MSGPSYPIIVECSDCGTETEITRAEAHDLGLNPDAVDTPKIQLQQRGWERDKITDTLRCPDCVEDRLPF